MSENAERNLRLFQELITCAHNVYFWTYDSHLANTYTNCPDAAVLNPLFLGNEEQTRLLLPLGEKDRPAVLEDSLGLLWIADYEKDTVGVLLYIHDFSFSEASVFSAVSVVPASSVFSATSAVPASSVFSAASVVPAASVFSTASGFSLARISS